MSGLLTCPLFCALIHKRNRKSGCRCLYGISIARCGTPAARRRDRNRSAWLSARPNALCVAPPCLPLALMARMRIALSLSVGSAPHASHGRQRFSAVSGRNMAVPLLIAHQQMTITNLANLLQPQSSHKKFSSIVLKILLERFENSQNF